MSEAGGGENGFVTRAQLLEKRPRRTKTITIPELDNQKVTIQSMTAHERGEYETSFHNPKSGNTRLARLAHARGYLAVACVVDQNGNRMLSESDVKALGEVDCKILERIAVTAKDLSGITDEDMDELVGNSEATTDSDS